MQCSDYVSLHLVLSEATQHIIDASALAAMRSTAYFVNTSRGGLVDTDALIDALRRGAIAGAALDVFDEEPLPAAHPLRSLPNAVCLPHLGYVTDRNYRRYYGEAVEDIEAFFYGEPIRVLN
jgi:phosphoglycerate dehydrogenase-like enzyme